MSRGLERARLSVSLSHRPNKMTLSLADNGVRGRKSAVYYWPHCVRIPAICRHPSHPCASCSIA